MQYDTFILTKLDGNNRLIYNVEGPIKPPKVELREWYLILERYGEWLIDSWNGELAATGISGTVVSFDTFDEMVLYFLHVLHAKP